MHLYGIEYDVHVFFLYQTDAMFAAQRAAKFFYQKKNLPDPFLQRTIPLFVAKVSFNDIYMEVTVSRVTSTEATAQSRCTIRTSARLRTTRQP